MRRALNADDFVASPVGAYFVTSSFAGWYPHETLTGLALWGTPSPDDIRDLTRFMEAGVRSAAKPRRSLVDMENLEAVCPSAFNVLAKYVTRHRERLSGSLIQQAVVRPAGVTGAIVAGFYSAMHDFLRQSSC